MEFCQDWKSQGILLKILEKSEKLYWKTKKYWKSQGNLSVRISENPANMVPLFKYKKKFFKKLEDCKKYWKSQGN